jgi:shikimate kinase / 3-dehydroquinate synthase
VEDEKRILHCDTCGQETEHLHRDVLDSDYNAMLKPAMWNCESCYRNKRAMRAIGGDPESLLDGRQIFVTGFMATGKSKISPILAALTERAYRDTDEMIVEAAAKSIPEIFDQDGETAFRDLENQCVSDAANGSPAIISLGGGAIAYERNWDVIDATGVSLCIQASVDTIYERVARKRDERPLLAGLSDDECIAKIKSMLAEREPFYSKANVFVTSDEVKSPEDTAVEAFGLLKNLG